MGDALCGPSNALQNFQKHTTVDRSLQQDRLALRQSSSQGFRSSHGPAGLLDPEFEAFQAGVSGDPIQLPGNRQFVGLPVAPFSGSFQAPIPAQPGWASDFQRLHISSPAQSAQFPGQRAAQPLPSTAGASTWHLDFLKSSPSAALNQPPQMYSRGPVDSMLGYAVPFHQAPAAAVDFATLDKGKSRASPTLFDEAAFDLAFEEAHADLVDAASPHLESTVNSSERMAEGRLPEERNLLMRMTWDRQPATYLVVKVWNAFGLSTEGKPFHQDTAEHASAFLRELENLQEEGRLNDEAEIIRTKKVLHRILQLDQIPEDANYQFHLRAQNLMGRINGSVEVLANESFVSPQPAQDLGPLQEQEMMQELIHDEPLDQAQETPQQQGHDDEELARTAGQLLDSVSDNTSQKFQESAFLALMRKLRDHEVRVEGDKMVETPSHAVGVGFGESRLPEYEQDTDLGRIPPPAPVDGNYAPNVEPFA